MKLSQGFKRGEPTAVPVIASGIGAVGAFVVGVAILREPWTIGRVVAAALIVAGLTLTKLSTPV